MEQIAFVRPEDVHFIDQCFKQQVAIKSILDAKGLNLRVFKNSDGKITEVYADRPTRVTFFSIFAKKEIK